MAFGRNDKPFLKDPSDPNSEYDSTEIAGPTFTSLTFVFAPSGQSKVGESVAFFDRNDPNCDPNDPNHAVFSDRASRAYLWDPNVANDPNCNTSVNAAVLFSYEKFIAQPTDKRSDYLIRYGQPVAVNRYTGAPLGR